MTSVLSTIENSSKIQFVDGEVIHSGPLATRQNYDSYSDEHHAVWSLLYAKQFNNLQDIAYSKWLDAMSSIGLRADRIPRLGDTAEKLCKLTRWIPVPVAGFLTAKDYFWYIAHRQFPTVPTMRSFKQIDFIVDPDLFHDAFGHLPMHSDPVFADFVELFGRVAYQLDDEAKILQMSRLYWFTVEYGLIREHGKIKVAGSGHLSGFQESRHSLTDAVAKRPFKLEDVVNTAFNPHVLQDTLFVMDSYEQLTDALIRKAKEFGVSVNL